MQTYEQYKESSIDWIGTIPEHWEVKKMKFLFIDFSKKNMPNETLLSVTQNQGVVPRDWVENRMVMPSGNLDSFKYIEKGDFCISLRSFEGGLEYCFHSGIVSPAYTVLKGIFKHHDGYYKYLFKSQIFIDELQLSIVGIREGKNISYELLKYDYLPIPPIHEQEAIANFLDDKTAKIDALVQTKEQQIEKLKELRQAKIHQAVTKGLDSNAPTKDSGIEWIGEIPAHWEVKKFRYTINLRHGYQFRDNDFTEEGIKIVKITQLNKDGFLDLTKADTISYSRVNSFKEIIIKNNDILMCLTGGTIGKIILVKDLDEVVLQNYRVGHFSSINDQLSNKFLFYILSADYFQKQINNDLSETGQPNIGMEDLKKMDVVIPRYFEQADIVAYLDEVTGKIDQAIAQKQEQITKLKEYKQSLINDVVTGKVKVC